MKCFTNLLRLFAFLCTVLAGNCVYGNDMLSPKEKAGFRDLIISQHGKITNLYVNFRYITSKGGEKTAESSYDWAMSGEKRYRKRNYPSPVGGPPSKRWGIAVWDGKFLKAYDSLTDNGSVRAEHKPLEKGRPQTYSPYSWQLGHYTSGTMPELFAKVNIKDWDVKLQNNGKEVVFRSNDIEGGDSTAMHTWTFDLERGCIITRYEITITVKRNGEYKPVFMMTVLESKEVKPGIWLPIRSHVDYMVYEGGQSRKIEKDIVVDKIKVNQPEIEDMFDFEWPKGSQYYDFTLGCTVIPHATDEGMQIALDGLAEDLHQMKEQEVTKSQSLEPAEATEKTKPKQNDDFELAEALIHSKVNHPAHLVKSVKAEKNFFQKFLWFWLAIPPVVLFIIVLIHRFYAKRSEILVTE